jgi:hypothetical protein
LSYAKWVYGEINYGVDIGVDCYLIIERLFNSVFFELGEDFIALFVNLNLNNECGYII